jgi:hypothetical protein
MKGLEKYYSIHGIVTFKIVNEAHLLSWQFNNIYNAYKNFEIEKSDELDFIIYLGKFTPSNQGCYIINNKYYVREDYFFCKRDSYKFANWSFEMSGFEDGASTVRLSSNPLGYLFMSGFVIDFLIQYKLNEKGFSIVHASCVSKSDMGFLFAARSGGGKTTFAMNFLEKGFNLLGDNFIILHQGKALSYFSPINIFTYNLAPIVKRNFGTKNKIILDLKELFYKATQGYIKIFTKINPREIFPHLTVDETKLNVVFLLIPKEDLWIQKIDKKELCDHLVSNQKLDALLFHEYISEYSYMFPKSKLATYWNSYRENLDKNLRGKISLYKVEIPRKPNGVVFEKISDVFSNERSV